MGRCFAGRDAGTQGRAGSRLHISSLCPVCSTHLHIHSPPSTTRVCPVMKAAAGLGQGGGGDGAAQGFERRKLGWPARTPDIHPPTQLAGWEGGRRPGDVPATSSRCPSRQLQQPTHLHRKTHACAMSQRRPMCPSGMLAATCAAAAAAESLPGASLDMPVWRVEGAGVACFHAAGLQAPPRQRSHTAQASAAAVAPHPAHARTRGALNGAWCHPGGADAKGAPLQAQITGQRVHCRLRQPRGKAGIG